ncbi:hypothetical protein ACLM5J_06820 [Nocardioides sp. Bht2]|uniref:hypothetical protein n=1 Tax=Nocardioides sp. Bht2 TaxID=3392297 RepID=UPI0039B6ACF0
MNANQLAPEPLIDAAIGLREARLIEGALVCTTPPLRGRSPAAKHALSQAEFLANFLATHTERLGGKMVRQIANYRPRDMAPADYAAIEFFVQGVIADTTDLRHKDPLAHVHAVASFVHWAHNLHGRPLEREAIFNVPLILNFTERVLSGKSAGYVSTYRSRLLGVAKAVNPRSVVSMPTRQRRGTNNPPYTDGDISRFLMHAAGFGRPYGRRSAQLVVALSAGAGLNPSDYVRLRNRHVSIDAVGPDSGITVHVPQGAGTARTSLKARRVMLLRQYEPTIRGLLSAPGLDPEAFVVWENVVASRENLQALTQGLKRTFEDARTRPVISRLRTTWIVRHLTWGTPTSVLLLASGLNSAESLHRYMDFVPEPDWDESRLWLRGPHGKEASR